MPIAVSQLNSHSTPGSPNPFYLESVRTKVLFAITLQKLWIAVISGSEVWY